jgi:hypothetical protein
MDTPDSSSIKLIDDLRRELAEARAERDEALARETATAERPEMTPELEGILAAIRRIAAGGDYGTATLRQIRSAMALAADPFAEARLLHLLGRISLEQRDGKFGRFWQVRPFESARRVFDADLETVRSRVTVVVREARSGKHCFYDRARDRFAWMSERGEDVLLPVVQQLQVEGLLTLALRGKATRAIIVTAASISQEIPPSMTTSVLVRETWTVGSQLSDPRPARPRPRHPDGKKIVKIVIYRSRRAGRFRAL